MKLQIQTWNLNLRIKLEIKTWNSNLKFKLEIQTWNWNLKLKLEIETWNSDLKFKLEIHTWNSNLEFELEIHAIGAHVEFTNGGCGADGEIYFISPSGCNISYPHRAACINITIAWMGNDWATYRCVVRIGFQILIKISFV